MGRVRAAPPRKRGGAGGRKRDDPRHHAPPTYDDPATQFAIQVVDKKVLAGKSVREACQRHLADLEEGRFLWDPSQGDRFAKFCRLMCRVSLPTQGGLVPFKLLPWQEFCAYSLLSWRVRKGDDTEIPPGARRFRYGFVLTAKGSGKSPFGAALGLYMMTGDRYVPLAGKPVREHAPQCYVLASTIDQAEEVGIKHAITMVKGSPRLVADMGIKPLESKPMQIVSTVRGSFLAAVGLSSKQGGAAGLNAHYLQWEEMHEQRDRRILDDYVAGFKGRPQPMLLMLTNAGRTKQSMGHEEYETAKLAAKGDPRFPTYFSFVAECDEEDIPSTRWWPSEKHWGKANPSLGITIRKDIIKDRIAAANTEAKRQDVLRLYFSIWSDANDEFVTEEQWKRAEVEDFGEDDERLRGATLFLGLDAASKDDMCALAYLWRCTDGKWRLKVRYFSPTDGFEDRATACTGDLLDWRKRGLIECPGGGQIDMRLMAGEIAKAVKAWGCGHVVCDSYRYQEFLNGLEHVEQPYWIHGDMTRGTKGRAQKGAVEIIQHPSSYARRERKDGRDLWMTLTIERFKGLIVGLDEHGPTIEIAANPVLRWNRECVVVANDPDLNKKFDKRWSKSRLQGKIDGLAASAMAVGLGVLESAKAPKRSPWEDPNYRWNR